MEKIQTRIPVTVLTGAGASRAEPINLPTMKEFFEAIMSTDHNPRHQRITNKPYFKYIMDSLYKNDKYYDLERVMGALYGIKSFTDEDCWNLFLHPNFGQRIFSVLHQSYSISGTKSGRSVSSSDFIETINTTIQNEFNSNKKNAADLSLQMEDLIREIYSPIANSALRKVYEPLFNILLDVVETSSNAEPIVPFFTTNYDMSIDWFFKALDPYDRPNQKNWLENRKSNINFIDGFVDHEWSEDAYNVELMPGEIAIEYHKLHGSLYWEKVAGVVRKNFSIARDLLLKQELVIVYPSDKKILSENPFYFSHRMLDKYLIKTNHLIVIGFSFRDPAIVQAISYALLNNPDLAVHVIHPKINPDIFPEMASFIKQHGNRVFHLEQMFGTDECIDYLKTFLVEI